MLELIDSVCLLGDPGRCKEVALNFAAEETTPHQCLMMAPPEIAKWVDSHPKWVATRWTCRLTGQVAKI